MRIKFLDMLMAAAGLAAFAALAGACPPVVYHAAPVVVREKVIVTEVVTPVVATVTAFPVLVPTYGASYVPPAQAPLPQPSGMDALLQRLDRLERKLDAPRGDVRPMDRVPENAPENAPQNAPQNAPLSPASIFGNRCASCHESAVSATKGGKFTFLRSDGKDVNLTAEQVLQIVSKVSAGEMPPKNPLPAGEKAVIRQWGVDVMKQAPDMAAIRSQRFHLRNQRWEVVLSAE